MKFFIDTEFIEAGHKYPIELLSIGIVAEAGTPLLDRYPLQSKILTTPTGGLDGFALYIENAEADLSMVSPWVQQNVLPHLQGGQFRLTRKEMGDTIFRVINQFPDKPEFWGYFADYDWVAFCQIFGRMIDLPKGWPMYCNDLIQLAVQLGVPKEQKPKQTGTEHHALADAIWNREFYRFLMKEKAMREYP